MPTASLNILPIIAILKDEQLSTGGMLGFRVKQNTRLVTLVHNPIINKAQAFYKSSGTNSSFPDTWFPFYGLNVNPPSYVTQSSWLPFWSTQTRVGHPIGYIFKQSKILSSTDSGVTIFNDISAGDFRELEQFYTRYCDKATDREDDCDISLKQFLKRFGSLLNLLISLKIGEGIWQSSFFAEFRQYLLDKYSGYTDHLPGYQIDYSSSPSFAIDIASDLEKIKALNSYIQQHGALLHEDLMPKVFGQTHDCSLKVQSK